MNDKEVRDVILSLSNDSFHETGQQTSSQKESDCTCRSESEPSCSGWQQRSPSLRSASRPNPSITTKLPGSWTESMNVVLCREVEYVNPFKFKERTKERGKAWEEAASNLKKHGYEITKRSVRDRYKNLKETVTKRNGKELKESGISPYLTDWQLEVTQIVEDLVEVEKETKEQHNDEVKKQLPVPVDGVEMRKRALESFTETNKRIKSEIDGPPRKRRNTGDDATNFLMRKLELDTEFKEREFQLKREEAMQRRQDEARRQDREEREEERRRSDEERRREKEDRDEERRRKEEERRREREEREEERRRDREEREEERRRKEEADRERRMELLQEQLLQQNQMIMMMLKKQQNE